MKHFAFFYLMQDKSDHIRETVPSHVAYWKELKLARRTRHNHDPRVGGGNPPPRAAPKVR
jgi:hypothetical protein